MMRVERSIRVWPVAMAVAVAWGLTACMGDSPEHMLKSAKGYMAKNDPAAAIIQLKNLVQEKPDDPEVRLLLGKAMMMAGDIGGAESEFSKALAGGKAQDEVVPLIAESLLLQRQFKKLEEQFGKTKLSDPTAQATLLTTLAGGRMALGEAQLASDALDAALAIKPSHPSALVEKARSLAGAKAYTESLAMLDKALAGDAKNGPALLLKGDVQLYGMRQPKEALQSYKKAAEYYPNSKNAHASIMRLHLGRGELDEAAKALEQLKQTGDGGLLFSFLEGQLALAQGKLSLARESAQKILKRSPDNAMALELAGLVEYRANALIQAEPFLSKAIRASSEELPLARRTLVLTYLRLGQVDKAVNFLPDKLDTSQDPDMLAAAGQVYMVQGKQDLALTYFERASQLDPTDSTKKTHLALSKLKGGQADLAFNELQTIAAKDTGVVADMALINALVQRRDLNKALEAITRLEAKKPNDPMPLMLRSQVLSLKGDAPGTQATLAQALKVAPDYFPAVQALAGIDMAQKKPQAALERFERFAEASPKHVEALLATADLKVRLGAKQDEVMALLNKAVEAAPDDERPRLVLIEYQLQRKEPKKALTTAQTAAAAQPGSAALLEALGVAQAAAGEHNQALSTFAKLVSLKPASAEPHLRMAAVHEANKDTDAAAQSLRKALEIQPDHLEAQRSLTALALRKNAVSDALTVVRDIQKQRPKEYIGFMMEGEVNAFAKKFDAAVLNYQKALEMSPKATVVAMKVHGALALAGRKAEADKFASDWSAKNAQDATFAFYLGDRALSGGDMNTAEKQFKAVLAVNPDNAVALNNLAWVSSKLGRKDALSLVEKANALAPNNPDILDTMATLLAANQQGARALEVQRKAVQLQPDAPVLKLNLAKLLIQQGQKAAAKETLQSLRQLGPRFAGQAEVDTLLKGL
jgi:cellulose synthase operon protein C